MERYIEQLISDIRATALQVAPSRSTGEHAGTTSNDAENPETIQDIEKYFEGEEEPIASMTGIATEALPPPDKLTLDQQALLASELEDLLLCFNLYLDFPNNYPIHLRYGFICTIWTESHLHLKVGNTHIEFCDYNEENCPFPGYCTICSDWSSMRNFDTTHAKSGTNNGLGLDNDDDWEDLFRMGDGYEDPNTGFVSGIFNDDGTRIDPATVPVPSLCVVCKQHQCDDPESNILCLLNRNAQRNEPNFQCGSFIQI